MRLPISLLGCSVMPGMPQRRFPPPWSGIQIAHVVVPLPSGLVGRWISQPISQHATAKPSSPPMRLSWCR